MPGDHRDRRAGKPALGVPVGERGDGQDECGDPGQAAAEGPEAAGGAGVGLRLRLRLEEYLLLFGRREGFWRLHARKYPRFAPLEAEQAVDLVPDQDGQRDAGRDHERHRQPEAQAGQHPLASAVLAGPPPQPLPAVGLLHGRRVEQLLLDLLALRQSHARESKGPYFLRGTRMTLARAPTGVATLDEALASIAARAAELTEAHVAVVRLADESGGPLRRTRAAAP